MAAVVGSLLAELGVDKSGLANGLRAAGVDLTNFENKTGRQFQNLDRKTSTAFSNMGRHVTTFSRGLVGGIAGAVTAAGFATLIRSANDAARSIARIGDQAKQAGLDVRSFQMLGYVAKQNRIEVDDLTAGVREMQLRFSEFVQTAGKSGAAADQLKRLGYTVDEIEKKLKNPLDLFTEIIGRVQKLSTADQIFAMDELFGGDGERLVRLLAEGEDGLRRMMQRAEDVGAVLSEDVIRNADEINRRFEEISDTVSLNLKSAIVQASAALMDFIDSFRDFENQRTSALDERLAELGRERLEIENKILALREEMANNQSFTAPIENRITEGTIKALEEQMAEIAKKEGEILGIIGEREYGKAGEKAGAAFADGAAAGIRNGDAAKAAEDAAKEAERAFERFSDRASRLSEDMFPGHAAAAEAAELLHLLDQFGDKLNGLERQAVENRIDLMFDSAAAGVRDLSKQSEQAALVIFESFNPVRDLFDGILDALMFGENAFEGIMRAAANVGRPYTFMNMKQLWKEV